MGFYVCFSRNISKCLTSETPFSNYFLTVDPCSKIPELYSMEIITTKELIDKLDMLQDIFGKIEYFDMQIRSLPPRGSKKNVKPMVLGLRHHIHRISK